MHLFILSHPVCSSASSIFLYQSGAVAAVVKVAVYATKTKRGRKEGGKRGEERDAGRGTEGGLGEADAAAPEMAKKRRGGELTNLKRASSVLPLPSLPLSALSLSPSLSLSLASSFRAGFRVRGRL